jgi:signal transduction histidine kinase
MTIRGRFTLIAACLLFPPVMATAVYFYFARNDFSDPKQIAVDAGTRDWAARALTGSEHDFSELTPGITALAMQRYDGVVIFSNVPGLSGGERVTTGELLERTAAAFPNADYIAESVTGEPGGGYVAVIRRPEGPWFANPYIVGMGLALVFECLVAIVGIVLMFRSSSSIKALSRAAERIAGGDLVFTLKGRGNDEVALLYRAFDGMRQKLIEARAGRSRFLRGVSHDLKTPLTSIKGYLQALAEGLAEDAATQEKFISILRNKADLLDSRIQELIEFAAFETSVWNAALANLKLLDFLHEIAGAAAADAAITDRKFSAHLRIDGASILRADPRLFQRVLENLLANALRYTRPGDTVTMEADEDDAGYRIMVRDNGPGIPAEDRERVFEEFYRGAQVRNEEGLGIGLSIVKTIVSAHGWRIRLADKNDAGTAFVLTIPKLPVS